MNYVVKNWVNGEVIYASELNKIENAIYLLSQSDEDATDADCDALFDNFLNED